jgi:hypothetical protein
MNTENEKEARAKSQEPRKTNNYFKRYGHKPLFKKYGTPPKDL